MDTHNIKKLAETVEAGLRDGRSLESLKNAMRESGYDDEKIRDIIGKVDRKQTIRRPARPKKNNRQWIAASIIILVLLISFSFLLVPQAKEESSGQIGNEITETTTNQGEKICYIVNESIKDTMIDAGILCDKWILIKEI